MQRRAWVWTALLAVLLVLVLVAQRWGDGDAHGEPARTAGAAGLAAGADDGAAEVSGDTLEPLVESTDGEAGAAAVGGSALAAAESDDAQRRAAAARELAIVVTCAGRPLADALVVIAPVLHDPPWDVTSEPHSWEREELRGVFAPVAVLAEARTDGDGVCTLPHDRLATDERAIVVAVLHERAYGDVRAIQTVDLPTTVRLELELEPAEPVRALVRGAAPREQVEVSQAALYGNFRLIDDYTDEWVSRPMLRHVHTRTGDGPVALFPVRERNLVAARAAAGEPKVGAPYVGALVGEIEVALGPSFTLEGRTLDLEQPMIEALVRVLAFDEASQRWFERGAGPMEVDGTFAPFEVAWLEGASRWQARAEAADRHTVAAEFTPSPGAASYVEFDAPTCVRYEVRVLDGLTGERIVGALVTVDWDGRVDPPWSERTLDNGEAGFGHLPVGVRLRIDVEADGYTREPNVRFWTQAITDARAFVVPLFPQCRVTGRIAPAVAGRTLLQAELERVEPVATRGQRFELEVVDGVFEFDGPGGESASLFLYDERGSCGPLVIPQGAGLVDIGTLELVPHASARARVIDGPTGAPIVGAEVDVRVGDGTYDSVAFGESLRTDDRGEVRFARFPGDGAWLWVRAPGRTSVLAEEAEFDGVTYDFGDVVLAPQRVFEVELVGEPRRWRLFRLLEWVEPPRSSDFDEAGRARVPVMDDASVVQLVDADGRVEHFRAVARLADLPQPFPWQAPAGRLTLSVVGVDESYPQYTTEHMLVLSWFDGFGWYERYVPFTCAFGALPTRRVPAANASYRVTDGEGRLCCWGRVDLAAGGDQELVIDLGRDAATLRVVDADGAPVPDVYVRGFDRRAPAARHRSSVGNFRTDGNGEARVPLLEGGALGLALLGPGGEIVPDVDTSGWRAGAVEEVVLAPSGGLDLAVRSRADAASPVAGASVTLHTHDERLYFTPWTSDAAGRVRRGAIAEGAYVLEVARAGHWSRRIPVEVAAQGATALDVLLPELARLDLRLVDASGAPLANRAVDLVHEGLGELHADWLAAGRLTTPAVTDAAGRLALDALPAGPYTVGLNGFAVGTATTGAGTVTVVVP
jgi:hypothetical protein